MKTYELSKVGGKPIYTGIACNVCRQPIYQSVIKATSRLSDVDICLPCAEKMGYKPDELARKQNEQHPLDARKAHQKKQAKRNAGVNPFTDERAKELNRA